jgi:hypothetical protein
MNVKNLKLPLSLLAITQKWALVIFDLFLLKVQGEFNANISFGMALWNKILPIEEDLRWISSSYYANNSWIGSNLFANENRCVWVDCHFRLVCVVPHAKIVIL